MPVALADDEETDLGTTTPEAALDSGTAPTPKVLDPEAGSQIDSDPEAGSQVDSAVESRKETRVDVGLLDTESRDEAAPWQAASIDGFFGKGKEVSFQIEYDDTTAPAGLDLSGAEFTLSGAEGDFVCTTDATGVCDVREAESWEFESFIMEMVGLPQPVSGPSHQVLPSGTYTVTQTAAAVGLAIASGTATVELCNGDVSCDSVPFEPVLNDSLFRSPVVSAVRDAVTGAPIEGAVYTLTGPGYPAGPTVQATSTADGSLTFPGWFLPDADYVLTQVGAVDGYQADVETTGIEIAPFAGDLIASVDARLLTPAATPIPADPSGPAATPVPVAAPVPAPGPAGGPALAGRVVARALAAPVAEPTEAADPSPSTPSATGTADRTTAAELTPPAPPDQRAAGPELATVSSNLPDRGLVMALGGLFLIVVLVAFGMVRRHARRRG
jgi:hypothetical protein